MSGEQLRVVLVDDHALCRNGLTDLLHHRGNITVVAALGDPDKVAAVLHEHKPDLVVLDLRMPSTDGLTLLTWRPRCVPEHAATCSRTWNPKR
jgi:two-component system nitrate/nitrite response regulator NarL